MYVKIVQKKGEVRVDVVWFGEQPKSLDLIYNFLIKQIFSCRLEPQIMFIQRLDL